MQIDFVIPWVDGSDHEWIKEFNKYCPQDKQIDTSNIRYRDNGLLKYWFRGVEKFAPWVRKVHFITNGQKPEWLNLQAPKLNFVKHSDYIPKEYLPIFSSHPIELYMHNIKDLSEHFVYFNDDTLLTNFIEQEFFFKDGLPCDCAILNVNAPKYFAHILLNNCIEINKNFNFYSVIKNNFFKWFNYKYGFDMLRTIFLLPYPRFNGFIDWHFAQPFKKSVIKEVWDKCDDVLLDTMNSKFRNITDVNQYLFRYWRLCKGEFHPTNFGNKKYFDFGYKKASNVDELCNAIKTKKYKEICINDGEIENYDDIMQNVQKAFDSILPEKSKFEL
ncbi:MULTISPECIES: Stealth CR1 domain-containing protein [unclassified Campylobacter]|uniref:Stealth CR1 domain-containing protein n=1 Tax=unclassified Campylobacter TaxID=2593542 RepID=UPI0022E9CB2B|nr:MULTISPECIES: Stealth CR1 domain-containing protein [unclassified Campylobacter]MDA3055410.1 Stealth CR1 domain-containing protein [Campylobacter sp. CN_NA1]MDA3064900.1 Stealth CR1 domain-containing protein [Campylobacter sp. CN_NE4]MDA3068276.1 Stealth CR1 domain-containing protein [Campylobacter sp. CN_NE3]MDA3082411.1 Stealth CR1 domain-containing protein [Campylobacter sp. CN_EL2]MDA3084046.1 Stealth CR1 domain-containing protein [Campylobacter sp. CN_NE1]